VQPNFDNICLKDICFTSTEGCTQLLSITELYLNDTFLEFLPASLGRLSKLRILELRENGLNTLPKSLSRLTCLERLDLGQNEISELPEVVGSLSRYCPSFHILGNITHKPYKQLFG
jgi:Leucine-rich repeat (LRR) protein